jgi:TolA-binding protein
MKRGLMMVAAAMSLACGCASTNSPSVSGKAAKALESYLHDIRVAASGTSVAQVQAAVQRFDSEVESLSQKGEISPQRAQKIENQALALESDFKARNKPTPPATPSATPSSTTPTASPSTSPSTPAPSVTVTVPPSPSITPLSPGSTSSKPARPGL